MHTNYHRKVISRQNYRFAWYNHKKAKIQENRRIRHVAKQLMRNNYFDSFEMLRNNVCFWCGDSFCTMC